MTIISCSRRPSLCLHFFSTTWSTQPGWWRCSTATRRPTSASFTTSTSNSAFSWITSTTSSTSTRYNKSLTTRTLSSSSTRMMTHLCSVTSNSKTWSCSFSGSLETATSQSTQPSLATQWWTQFSSISLELFSYLLARLRIWILL